MPAFRSTERGLTDHRGSPDPMVRVAKLGFVTIRTADVERMVSYYENALGFSVITRESSRTYLTCAYDHHCVIVEAGEPFARTEVGFEIDGSLDLAAGRLRDGGIAVERQTEPEPGIVAKLIVEEPGGAALHLYEGQSSSERPTGPGPSPTKLGHVAAHVGDLADIQRFYENVLGFRWSDTIGDYFVFMRCSPDHHTVNFIARPNSAGRFGGMHHVAYEMRDLPHLRDGLDNLSKHGVQIEWGIGRHGAGHNLFSYHRDPDGNIVELFTELDVISDERTGYFEPRPWHAEYPQGPRVWKPGQPAGNIWGPLAPWRP